MSTSRSRPYFTLVAIDGTPTDTPWGIAFGDFDKDVVEAEMEDYRENGWTKKQLKIIKTASDQASIDAAVAALNAQVAA